MSTAVTRLVPRRKGEAVRTAEHIRADLEAIRHEGEAALAQAATLGAKTRQVLLSGDDAAHERHEAEVARHRRIYERTEARREDLEAELAVVEAREAEDAADTARAKRKADAEAAIASVRAKFASHYTEPAETIAAFLAELQGAEVLAREAGIAPPLAGVRNEPARIIEPSRRSWEAYVGPDGGPTMNPHPVKADGTYDRTRTRELRTFHEEVPGRTEMGRRLPDLTELVRLPRLDQVGDHHHGKHPDRGNRW